jgi:hypothetical protein
MPLNLSTLELFKIAATGVFLAVGVYLFVVLAFLLDG